MTPIETLLPENFLYAGHLEILDMVGSGMITGNLAEWPQVKDACRFAAKALASQPVTMTEGEDLIELRKSLELVGNASWQKVSFHYKMDGDKVVLSEFTVFDAVKEET